MKLIITYCLTFIILCLLFSTDVKSQNDSIFYPVESFLKNGDTNRALLEAERIIFVFLLSETESKAIFKKALIYKAQKEYANAQKCLERVDFLSLNDSLSFTFRYQTALNAYLAGNFSDAEFHILQIKNNLADTQYFYQVLPLYALTLNELQKWNEASIYLHEFIDFRAINNKSYNKDSLHAIISHYYSKRNIPKMLEPEKAQIMSMIVPGSGQVYAGYFWEGASNFLFSISSLALAGYGFYKKYYLTGYFVGLGLFQKFYFGGHRRSEILVNQCNYRRIKTFNNKLKPIILML